MIAALRHSRSNFRKPGFWPPFIVAANRIPCNQFKRNSKAECSREINLFHEKFPTPKLTTRLNHVGGTKMFRRCYRIRYQHAIRIQFHACLCFLIKFASSIERSVGAPKAAPAVHQHRRLNEMKLSSSPIVTSFELSRATTDPFKCIKAPTDTFKYPLEIT